MLLSFISFWQCHTTKPVSTEPPSNSGTGDPVPPVFEKTIFNWKINAGYEGLPPLRMAEDLVHEGVAYFVKNKASQKYLEIKNSSMEPGAQLFHNNLNGSINQKFVFEKVDNDFFYIRTMTGGHYLTVKQAGGTNIVTQEPFAPVGNTLHERQKWTVVLSDEATCFYIQPKAFETSRLQPQSVGSGVPVIISAMSNTDNQKWLFKITTLEGNPDSKDSGFGLTEDCIIYDVFDGGLILPEWRCVGEDFVPNGTTVPPLHTYRVLEGVVKKGRAIMAFEDLPISHFTHDFTFHVNPDPAFSYLLGIQGGSKQENIEVEWESGLAQVWAKNNPAAQVNNSGKSLGFYTAGHERRDVIWNWPTSGDWVHVEGAWVWDRGHPPAKTEIHPPRFVAVQRKLPAKYEEPNNPGRYYYATRCDLYGNGDGNIIWNNKDFHPFVQNIQMSEKNYTVVFKHKLPHPAPNNPNIKLAYRWEKRKGDTFSSTLNDVKVQLFESGTPDVPEPHAVVTIPWASDQRPDDAVFARTLYLFWDDFPTHGLAADFPMRAVRLGLKKVTILDKKEGNDYDAGEYCLFLDIGGNYVFLNEFTSVDSLVTEGLGTVYSEECCISPFKGNGCPGNLLNYPPNPCNYEFSFDNVYFTVYVPISQEVRFNIMGWERDFMDGHFGEIVNPFAPCRELSDYVYSLSRLDAAGQGGFDDPVGQVQDHFRFCDILNGGQTFTRNSSGSISPDPIKFVDDTDPNNSFQVSYYLQVLESIGPPDPCKFQKNRVKNLKIEIAGLEAKINPIMKQLTDLKKNPTDPKNQQEILRLSNLLTVLAPQLNEKKAALSTAEAELADCLAKNPGWEECPPW